MTKTIKPVLIIFCIIIIQISLMVLFSKDGFTNPDSFNYLRMAREFASNNTLFISDVLNKEGHTLFAVWPVGYPTLVGLFAKVIPLDILYVSKITNIVLLGVILLLLAYNFKEKAWLFGCMLLSDSLIRLTPMTLSELPFLVSATLLAIGLLKFHQEQSIKWLFIITFAGITLFCSRYIGLFGTVPIGIVGLHYLYNKNLKGFTGLLVSGIIITVFAAAYLLNNYNYTGTLTGMERVANTDSFASLTTTLFKTIFLEIKTFLIIAIIYIIGYKLLNKEQNQQQKQPSNAWKFFLLVGVSYFLCIVAIRFNAFFDNFSNRLLAPATFLISIAALDYLLQYKHLHKHIRNYVIIMVSVLLMYHITVQYRKNTPLTLPKVMAQKYNHYSYADLEGILLFGDYDTIYYSSKTQPAASFPFYGPRIYASPITEDINENEDVDAYTERLCRESVSKNIYIDIKRAIAVYNNYASESNPYTNFISKNNPKHQAFFSSVLNIINNNKNADIVLLRKCTR